MTDVRKIKTVGRLLFKLETRSRSGSNKKLLFTMFTYMLPGLFLPFLLAKQNADSTGFEFVFLTYLFYSLLISFTIITELDNLVISKAETNIFSSMPIEDELIVRGKLYVIIRYVFILSVPLLIPGSIYFYLLLKSFPRTVMYFIAGFMLCLFLAYTLILLYSIALKILNVKRISTITLIFQLVLILAIIIGYQFISYGITKTADSGIHSYIAFLQKQNIINYFPQSWYALLPSKNHYVHDFVLVIKAALPVFLCYMSYLSLKLYLIENYSKIREKFLYSSGIRSNPAAAVKKKSLSDPVNNFLQKIYLRNYEERASFGFMQSMFRQDKTVKLSIIPMIIIPAGLAIFALITNQIPPPFERDYFSLRPVLHISILLAVLIAINTGMIGIRVSNYPGAAWIYEAFPLESKNRFRNGIRKFFTVYLLLPVCILLGIIFIFKMPFEQAVVHSLFIFAAANFYGSLFNIFRKVLPFTKENTMVNSLQRVASLFFPMLYGIILILVQLSVYRSIFSAMICILVLLTVNFWLNYFGFVRIKA